MISLPKFACFLFFPLLVASLPRLKPAGGSSSSSSLSDPCRCSLRSSLSKAECRSLDTLSLRKRSELGRLKRSSLTTDDNTTPTKKNPKPKPKPTQKPKTNTKKKKPAELLF